MEQSQVLQSQAAQSQAVCLVLTFERIGNRKKVSNVNVEVEADKEFIAVSKMLLDSEELDAVTKFDTKLRQFVVARTLPSLLKGGVYLLPVSLIAEVEAKFLEAETQRKELVSKLIEAYPMLVTAAKEKLRGLFNPSDYPSVARVASKFTLSWRYVTFNTPATLEEVNKEIFERERVKAEAAWRETSEAISQLLRTELQQLISHLVERLTPEEDGKPRRFKQATIDNLKEFLSMVDARNITNDVQLKEVADRARLMLDGVDVSALRSNEAFRSMVANGFYDIKKTLEPLIAEGGRAITFDEE